MNEVRGLPERRHDIDWLRVLAVLLLVPYHTAVIFDRGHVSYIKGQPNAVMEAFAHFLFQWHMPLFFLLSGAATRFSLGVRSGGQYIGERTKRLAVPLVFGTLAIIPLMVYYQRLYYHEFVGSYVDFYPHFFEGIYPRGNFSWGHLWFLAYLFVFSMLALPLFLSLRKGSGGRLVAGLASVCERRGAIFLLAVPLAISEAALRARWPNFQNLYDDWANFSFYLIVFIYGYLLFSDARFGRALERHARVSLGLGLICMSAIFALRWTGAAPAAGYSPGWISYMILTGFNSWFWIVAILGFGRRYLNFGNKVLKYAVEAALPFYVLHHAVIVVTGYYALKLNAGVLEKFLVICVASLIATIFLYDSLVRRTKAARLLFGMKPRKATFLPPVRQTA